MSFQGFYKGKKVLVTGHTGFKGSWLCEWLLSLGAHVIGFSLAPATSPDLFTQLGLAGRLAHNLGDVRDLTALQGLIEDTKPDLVFHLAAQSLVRLSYQAPVETYGTNVMGTVNLLEAVRLSRRTCSVVVITTDKCYENQEWVHSYREIDPLGGHDPYSSSKGAAELVVSAYRRSYFSGPDSHVRLASARAGNVIGGGDWALDRIVPDCIRSLERNELVRVRNKVATRPWQHVLEPLSGYLWLGTVLAEPALLQNAHPGEVASAFNFGPSNQSNRTVGDLVFELLKSWPGGWQDCFDPKAKHEATLLNLSTDKALHLLSWKPLWNFEQTVAETVSWYRTVSLNQTAARECTLRQLGDYEARARAAKIAWSEDGVATENTESRQ